MPFHPHVRHQLLLAPGISSVMVTRLEAAGFETLDALKRTGAEAAIERVCELLGTQACRNRVGALRRALAALSP